MERAGVTVARAAARMARAGDGIAVLCGPGNNGGDGFVAARHLSRSGYRPQIFLSTEPGRLQGDAAVAAGRYSGDHLPLSAFERDNFGLVVDALFGAGLTRPVTGQAAEAIGRAGSGSAPILAVDLPSGVDGTSGAVLGCAAAAQRTVTFGNKKPGHLLLPGRDLCGEVVVADIGLPVDAAARLDVRLWENHPDLWCHWMPQVEEGAHKFRRGHVGVLSGGPASTGAARMAAAAAQRAGAGVVTILSPSQALLVNAAQLTSIMVQAVRGPDGLAEILSSRRVTACVLGPGAGVDDRLRAHVLAAADSNAALVLDADALTAFAERPDELFACLASRSPAAVLTPHEGEFSRLFAGIDASLDKVLRARKAAASCKGVVVLKGADTIVAHPDGRAVINAHACRWLATAGSGDVLAGAIAALLGQGMPAFEAACAAVWLHGEAGRLCGVNLIAEDVIAAMPAAMARFAEPG